MADARDFLAAARIDPVVTALRPDYRAPCSWSPRT